MLRKLKTGLLLAAIAAIAGCATAPQRTQELLDPQTSATITYSPSTMLLYRDDPAHAAHARNLVSLGPLQVNRSGHYQYFLWLGIWNTNHTVSEADGRDGFDSIVLFVDGEPLTLDVSGWTPDTIGASAPVYMQPVASALDAYYEVTVDQLRVIAEGDDLSILTTGFRSHSFELWDEQIAARADFRRFVVVTY
jgi:hypothetical protein